MLEITGHHSLRTLKSKIIVRPQMSYCFADQKVPMMGGGIN